MTRFLMGALALTVLLISSCSKEITEAVNAPKSMAEVKSILSAMPENERPQFIVVSFDDALHGPAYDYTQKLLGYGHKNPNGAPIPVTYYISLEYTDYHLVQQRYAQGCEIAVHTMTHTTGVNTSYDTWSAEIAGCKSYLSTLARVPREKINGFRAPFLAHSDNSFKALWDQGFLYESSITEQIGHNSKDVRSFIFPYTFDTLGTQTCSVGECPKEPYPGLWELPMWGWHNASGQLIANMDPPGGYADLLAMFNSTFDTRYSSNRAPMGVFLHPGWLSDDAHAKAINDFLARSLAKPGVWVVTAQQLIEWMKDPKTISEMNSFAPVQWKAPTSTVEVADGWDNDKDGQIDEGFVKSCQYGSYQFNTTADECPDAYPSPNVQISKKITASVQGTVIGRTECPNPLWKNGVSYPGGTKVTYNSHTWSAKWYASETPGASQWGAWVDEGQCASDIIEYHGKITPSGNVRINENRDTMFTITADAGYRIKDVIVDGKSVGAKSSVSFTGVTADHSIQALFELDDNAVFHAVTASASAGGTITPSGTASVREGSSVTYAVAANAGFRIADVKVNGVSKGALSSITIDTVKAAQTIEASFTAIPKYTVDVSAFTGGTVTPGDTSIYEGSSITYTFAAAAGYRLTDVKVNGVSKGAVSTFAVTAISANVTIEPIFTAIPKFTVDVAYANGTVTPGDTSIYEGSSITYSFTPASGYSLKDVKVDGVSKGAVSTYAVTAISANVTIEPIFELIPIIYDTVTVTKTAGGTVSGNTIVLRTTTASFTITPDAGYRIADVVLDGVSKGKVTSVSIPSIASNHALSVSFEPIPVICDTVFVTASAGGTVSPAGTVIMERGTSKTFTIAANSGYELTSLKRNGTAQTLASSISVSNISGNVTIEAVFSAIVYHTVRVVKTGTGTVSTDTSFQIRSGRDTTISFTPASGWKIGTVTLNGTDKGALSSITLSKVSANQTVGVQFVQQTGSICDGVAAWSASQNWTSYKVGDKRVNGGKLWTCKVPGYAFYEPSSSWGYLGWTQAGVCQ